MSRSRFTEAIFRHPTHGERVYFCDTLGLDADTVVYRARALLREDPRNDGVDGREFEFVGFRYPQGPTDAIRDNSIVSNPPALRVLDGGKKKPPVEW